VGWKGQQVGPEGGGERVSGGSGGSEVGELDVREGRFGVGWEGGDLGGVVRGDGGMGGGARCGGDCVMARGGGMEVVTVRGVGFGLEGSEWGGCAWVSLGSGRGEERSCAGS